MSPQHAHDAVPLVRSRYRDPSCGWLLFPDTLHALSATAAEGWRNVVLSNHVPELAVLICGLGIGDWVDDVITSAHTGYEKPHPQAYLGAIHATGNPDVAWMVGDNPVADVQGAEAVGLSAILVRRAGVARRPASDLSAAVSIILSS